jgi:multidrug efflux system membrane fusion protein
MKLGEPITVAAPPMTAPPARSFAQRAVFLLLKLVTWVCVLAAIAGGGYLYYDKIYLPSQAGPAAAPPKRPIPILAGAARRGNMNLYLNGLGTVTAFNVVTVRSRVDGELMNVAFQEGQLVKQGDLLAEIDPRSFQVQLNQAEGPLMRDRASLEVAKTTFERYQQLARNNAISQQELDTQGALVKQAEGSIQTDLAAIENAKLQLDYCRIVSPITGRIGLRLVDRGNMIRANDVNGLAVVTQLQPIAVVFTIPQDEIVRVRQRMHVEQTLQVEVFDRDFSHKLASGTLAALDNQVDSTTGTIRLKAVFPNDDEMLFPNQFVNVRLLVDVQKDVVLAPTSAVQRGPAFTFVYVLKSDSTVELRKIQLGASEGNETIVLEGLEAGEKVVTDGLEKLQPGAAVALRDASKKPGAGSPGTASPGTGSPAASSDPAAKPVGRDAPKGS